MPTPGDLRQARKDRFRDLERARIRILQQGTGLAAGVHRSSFKGHGVEFSDLREYVPGDDLRAIDWKVTARLDLPFVRLLAEERDVTVCFAIDLSGSTSWGTDRSKADTARRIAGSLAVSAARYNDAVGLLLFSDRVEKYIPPRKGRRHLLEVLNALFDHPVASPRTDIVPAIRYLAGALRRQSSIVLVSDFIAPPFIRELSVLSRRHQVFAVRVADRKEEEIPDIGCAIFEDGESGEQLLVDTSDTGFRERYRAAAALATAGLSRDFARKQIPLATIMTGGDPEPGLHRFFQE